VFEGPPALLQEWLLARSAMALCAVGLTAAPLLAFWLT
jgi:hypothetical protein